jgi:adenine deaminase
LRCNATDRIVEHVTSCPAQSIPADLALAGGHIVDVRSGTQRRAGIAIWGDSILAIGPDDQVAANARRILDVSDHLLVPGYIEPHGHVLGMNPIEFAKAVLARGTTTAVIDALPLMMLLPLDRLEGTLERLAALPMKIRWLIRLHPPSFGKEAKFAIEQLRRLWRRPYAAAVGEVTRWIDVLQGDADLLEKMRAAKADGKRVEGHAPGASYERLVGLAAAGFTSCHEAVTAEEASNRLRAGLYTMLRHSSIRPDLPELVKAITSEHVSDSRLMFTADGPTPSFIASHGYMDHLIDIAVRSGVPPMAALRMATLNPANYYGWQTLGEIAPGKHADINVLKAIDEPTPVWVIANGKVVAHNGRLTADFPSFEWNGVLPRLDIPRVRSDDLHAKDTAGIRLVNDVISQPVEPVNVPEDALHVALIDRAGHWVTRARLIGFADRLGGLAATVTSAFDFVVIGQNPQDMLTAFRHLGKHQGGIVVVEEGEEVFSFPLDLGGIYSSRPWSEVAEKNRRFAEFMRSRGYPFSDPIFSLLFLTFDSLPWIRLTSRGVWDVRNRRVLVPSFPLNSR